MTSSPKRTEQVLSFLTPDQCERANGLPGVAVQGVFTDAECSVAGFRVNRAFVEFMHDVIRTTGPTDPSLQEAAAEQGNGWVYIMDLRRLKVRKGACQWRTLSVDLKCGMEDCWRIRTSLTKSIEF
jgi:hypothetical protein